MVGESTQGSSVDRVDVATSGLFLAWLANDIEELFTMVDTSTRLRRDRPQWLPEPPWGSRPPRSQAYLNAGVAAMGSLIAAAAYRGYRTRGDSSFFQNALLAFGVHGIGHTAASLVLRRYTSGVATSPTVVIPYWLWATKVLQDNGVPEHRSVVASVGWAVVGFGTAHAVGFGYDRCQSRQRR